MSKKELLQHKARAKIEEYEASLEVARAKLEGKSADARHQVQWEIERIEEGLTSAKARLAELADSADDAWDQIAGKLDSLAKDVGARIERIVSRKD
jgi:hypothetical protein